MKPPWSRCSKKHELSVAMIKVKKLMKSFFNILGFEVKRNSGSRLHYHNGGMIAGIQRSLHRNPTNIATVIDVGAAWGSWSMATLEFLPTANYVLFEPLVERKDELEQLVRENENFHFVAAAAGKEQGTTLFYVASDLDGSGIADPQTATHSNVREVKVTSINDEIKKLNLPGPYVIKLDTHGFEVPIIEGCSTIIDQVSLFIIECYGFQIAKDSLLFWEMCRFMEDMGFRLIDIVDITRRPKDNSFWQCDAFFVPATFKCFESNTYL